MVKDLRKLRKQHRFSPSQKDIAKLIGCSLSQYKRYENGESSIPLDVAIKWAEALEISIDQFIKLYRK